MSELVSWQATADGLLATTVVTAVVAIVLSVLSHCFTRPRLWHALWVVVLLKMFTPMGIPVVETSWGFGQTTILSAMTGDVASVTSSRPPSSVQTTVSVPGDSRSGSPPTPSPIAATDTGSAPFAWPQFNDGRPPLSVTIFAAIWGAVAIALTFRTVRRGVIFRRLLGHSTDDPRTERLLIEVGRRVGCVRLPRVCLVEAPIPPLLWAVGRTSLVLPGPWWRGRGDDQRRVVLAHELIHFRRRDHWVSWLRAITRHLFWWHPVVWWADRKIDALAEQCCDGEVIHHFETQRRSYALSLLSVAEWIGGDHHQAVVPALTTPMTSTQSFECLHRRIEMLSNTALRPWTRRQWFAAGITGCLLLASTVGFSQDQPVTLPDDKPVAPEGDAKLILVFPPAALTGRVTDTEGEPIAGATVRCVIPPTDLRRPIDRQKHRIVEAKTDRSGHYGMLVDQLKEDKKASIDVIARGYRRLVGTMMAGGDPNEIRLKPGEKESFDAKLPPSLYFAGKVVDPAGEPIVGASVFAGLSFGRGSGGVTVKRSDERGGFEIFGYEQTLIDAMGANGKAANAFLMVSHPDFVDTQLRNIQDRNEDERESIVVTMRRGVDVSGRVIASDGVPVASALVAAVTPGIGNRRAAMTDASGHFTLTGLTPGDNEFRVVQLPIREKFVGGMNVGEGVDDVTIRLQPIEQPLGETVEVLGMTLADVTPDIVKAYESRQEQGVMVVDVGDNPERLEVGGIRAGDVFWMVGGQRVSNLDEMLTKLVDIAERLKSDGSANSQEGFMMEGKRSVRVVYDFHNVRGAGNNTQYMHMTPEDIEAIKAVIAH